MIDDFVTYCKTTNVVDKFINLLKDCQCNWQIDDCMLLGKAFVFVKLANSDYPTFYFYSLNPNIDYALLVESLAMLLGMITCLLFNDVLFSLRALYILLFTICLILLKIINFFQFIRRFEVMSSKILKLDLVEFCDSILQLQGNHRG